jgi:hypothetical protein
MNGGLSTEIADGEEKVGYSAQSSNDGERIPTSVEKTQPVTICELDFETPSIHAG